MKYIHLESAGLEVSRITLGTWAIGGSHWGAYDEKSALRAIEAALDNGINVIDTAPAYGEGHAEELVARAVRGRRERVIIATKCGIDVKHGFRIDLSPAFIGKEIEGSLKRLRTEYVDLYQCHWPDPNTPIGETMNALLRLKRDGKIRHIGVSNFSAADLEESMRYAPVVSLQPQYSLLERDIESGIQALCTAGNIAIIPYGSLGAGVLTGKYRERPSFRKDDARSFFYKFFHEKYWPRVAALVDLLRVIAEEKNAQPGHVAIAWLLSRTGVASVLAGARDPSQVLDNLRGADITLSEEEIGRLDAVSADLYK